MDAIRKSTRAMVASACLLFLGSSTALAQPGILVIQKERPSSSKSAKTGGEEWSPTWSGNAKKSDESAWRARVALQKSKFRFASQTRHIEAPTTPFRKDARLVTTTITEELDPSFPVPETIQTAGNRAVEDTLAVDLQRPEFLDEAPGFLPESIVPETSPVEQHAKTEPRKILGWDIAPPLASGIASRLDHCSNDTGCSDECGERLSFREDFRSFPRLIWDDAKDIINRENLLLFGIAAGGAIAIHQNLDGEVRLRTERHSPRLNNGADTLGEFGDVPIQVPALLATYAYSVWSQNTELHGMSKSLISAYTITGITTVTLKGIVDSDRPTKQWNNGRYGFPSFHTASSFTIAAVLDEYYGAKVGLPAYAFAGLIGYSRIDERDHDLSDVVFGAALGYVIGKSVAGKHLRGDSRVRLLPYVHPTNGSTGVMLECPF